MSNFQVGLSRKLIKTSGPKLGLISKSCFNYSRISSFKAFHSYCNEPSHPIAGRKPKYTNLEGALSLIKSGHSIYIHGMSSTPKTLIKALAQYGKANNLKDITVHHLIVDGKAEYTEPDLAGIFRANSLFTGASCRKSVNEGRGDYTPIFLQDTPSLFRRNVIKLDATLVQVTPVDKHGYHSLGLSVDCTRAAVENSAILIGQVNPRLPRTNGDAIIHESHFDALVEVQEEINELPAKNLTDADKAIGKLIAENLVADGATLQMGIGGIPDAVLAQLTNHRDLGVHSEMFADGVMDLFEVGAITNNRKMVERGRCVATFIMGSRKLFDWLDDNPFVVMRTCDWVNKESVISANPRVTAINSCIEIDLVGNVCSDTIGPKVFSGFGGQVDFLRGAAMSFDGLGVPILALPSTTSKGESKIVPFLKSGASVTSTRAHVQYVVTEHGIANLFGKNYRQRAYALIQIADPSHRENLEKAAFERLQCMPSP